MKNVQRVIAAGALGFPLLLAAPGMALADGPAKPHKPSVSQSQGNDTDQSNANDQAIYQLSVGGHGDQSALNWNDQDNDNATSQDQQVGDEEEG